MQQEDFSNLRSDLVEKLSEPFLGTNRDRVRREVGERIDQEVRDGRLRMTLSPDEVNLLTDYRILGACENTNGIFHWKKR